MDKKVDLLTLIVRREKEQIRRQSRAVKIENKIYKSIACAARAMGHSTFWLMDHAKKGKTPDGKSIVIFKKGEL